MLKRLTPSLALAYALGVICLSALSCDAIKVRMHGGAQRQNQAQARREVEVCSMCLDKVADTSECAQCHKFSGCKACVQRLRVSMGAEYHRQNLHRQHDCPMCRGPVANMKKLDFNYRVSKESTMLDNLGDEATADFLARRSAFDKIKKSFSRKVARTPGARPASHVLSQVRSRYSDVGAARELGVVGRAIQRQEASAGGTIRPAPATNLNGRQMRAVSPLPQAQEQMQRQRRQHWQENQVAPARHAVPAPPVVAPDVDYDLLAEGGMAADAVAVYTDDDSMQRARERENLRQRRERASLERRERRRDSPLDLLVGFSLVALLVYSFEYLLPVIMPSVLGLFGHQALPAPLEPADIDVEGEALMNLTNAMVNASQQEQVALSEAASSGAAEQILLGLVSLTVTVVKLLLSTLLYGGKFAGRYLVVTPVVAVKTVLKLAVGAAAKLTVLTATEILIPALLGLKSVVYWMLTELASSLYHNPLGTLGEMALTAASTGGLMVAALYVLMFCFFKVG